MSLISVTVEFDSTLIFLVAVVVEEEVEVLEVLEVMGLLEVVELVRYFNILGGVFKVDSMIR